MTETLDNHTKRSIIEPQNGVTASPLPVLSRKGKPMDDLDPLTTAKVQLVRIVEGMTEWQARLVLSFVSNLFGSSPTTPKEHTNPVTV